MVGMVVNADAVSVVIVRIVESVVIHNGDVITMMRSAVATASSAVRYGAFANRAVERVVLE